MEHQKKKKKSKSINSISSYMLIFKIFLGISIVIYVHSFSNYLLSFTIYHGRMLFWMVGMGTQ